MNKEQTPQLSLQELAFELAQAVKILIGDIKSKPNDTRYLTSMKVGETALLKYYEFSNSLTSPATVSGDEIKSKQDFVDWFFSQKPYWPTPHQCYDWFMNNVMQPPVSGKEVEDKKFNVGDKINLNTGYSCDIGIVEKYENGIVYWKNSLGDTLYNTPVDKYNITIIKKATTPIKEAVTDGVDDKFEFAEWVISDRCDFIFSKEDGIWYQYADHFPMTTSELYTLFQKSKTL